MAPSQSITMPNLTLWRPANLTLINSTPFTWSRTNIHSYQMVSWDRVFPDKVNPGDVIPVQIEFSMRGNWKDDGGDVRYSSADADGTPFSLEFHARVDQQTNPFVQVNFAGSSTFGNSPGSVYNLGWNPWSAAGLPFIFSGFDQTESFASTNPPTDWMHQNLPFIGCQPLKRLCMPGAHDSGMSKMNGKTAFAEEFNTLTHWTDVAGQLNAGFRYFDLRPVIASGQFYTGHYSDIANVNWQGGNGQSIAEIVSQVNDFTSSNRELVILNLSHMINTDDNYRTLTQDEFNRLINQLGGLNHLYSSTASDLASLKLNDFIKDGPAVVLVLNDGSVHIPSPAPTGLFPSDALKLYDSYSNTDNLGQMQSDQLNKMSQQRTSTDSSPFLLSWTLTTIADIRMMARLAHNALWDPSQGGLLKTIFGQPKGQAQKYPNVLYLDGIGTTGTGIGHGNVAALAMAINHWALGGSC